MHAKYAFLHCSYSAPVRVSGICVVLVVVARAVTDVVPARGMATRADVFVRAGVPVRAPVARDVFVIALLRGASVVVRAAVFLRTVVAVRLCTAVGLSSVFPRDNAVPSRTAALAKPTHINRFAAKNRIFFISDRILAKLRILAQVNNRI